MSNKYNLIHDELGYFHESRKATASDWILGAVTLAVIAALIIITLRLIGYGVI